MTLEINDSLECLDFPLCKNADIFLRRITHMSSHRAELSISTGKFKDNQVYYIHSAGYDN